jgi:hypothetical protein
MNGGSVVLASALCREVPPVPLSAIRTEPPEVAPYKGVSVVPWVPPGKAQLGREGAPESNFAAILGRAAS